MDISKYRMISGLRSQQASPMAIRRQSRPEEQVHAPEPEVTQVLFKAEEYDKDHTFNYLQHRWFKKQLEEDEVITMTARQLKKFCDEAHEMGKMRQAILTQGS